MRIPKLFKKAAALCMAAVTALSLIPATTAFAAGDIGTISFSHTYDSSGNAMRYNSSATINGYTAGGTGNYKYRMSVDGETAFCIQPGVPLKTGNTLKKASSDTWNALSANQKKAVGLALLYGYQGNRSNLTGSDDEKWLATQTLVWEFVTGCREATGSYRQTSTTIYSLHFGSNYANSGARAAYDQIVSLMSRHNTLPSFLSGGKNDITKELAYKDGKYSITLTDKNGVLSDYSFTSSDANVSVSKDGNKLTISSKKAISGSVRITATRNGVPTVSDSARLIAYGDPNLQDLVTGVENADSVKAYINVETPTGTIALKKTSEDGVVAGISFHIKGDGFDKTVKTDANGNLTVEGLFPATYTITEQPIDRYEPQQTQTVTLIGGKTTTVNFNNTLKRGSLEVVKTSEDNLVEGMKFHLYGTSLSGLPIDEYAVTDKKGLAKFENVLISGNTPYVLEEVDTAVRYVVPESQTAPIEWKTAIATTVSAEDGSFSFEKVPYGTWIVREIESPKGFVLSEEEIAVTVGKVDEVVEISLVNYRIRGNIGLTKVDKDYPDNKLSGAEFEVYADTNGNGELDKDDELLGKMTEIEVGVYQMKELLYGKYFVKETKAPEGYVLDENVYPVSIEENGKTYVVENEAGKGFLNEAQKGSLKIVRNTPIPRVRRLQGRQVASGICVAILPPLAMAFILLGLTPESNGKTRSGTRRRVCCFWLWCSMSYITNVGAGQGLLKVGSSLVPFVNKFPRNTELYKLMTTKFGEV